MIRLSIAVLLGALGALSSAHAEPFSKASRANVLDRIAHQIEANYVYRGVADKTAMAVRRWKSDPALLDAPDERAFAAVLTQRLRKIDGHFGVEWKPPARDIKPERMNSAATFSEWEAHHNNGFEAVECLPGNIGYIRLRFFADFDRSLSGTKTPAARKTAEASLAFIQNTNAVIVDIRHNGGGSPQMVDLLLSAFFGEKPVLPNRFYKRKGNRLEDFLTFTDFNGMRRPVPAELGQNLK